MAISYTATVLVALLSIIAASLWEVAPLIRTLDTASTASSSSSSFDLYSTEYESLDVRAPVASSWRLRLVARLLVGSPLGDYLARRLLVRNGVPALVDLAHVIQNDKSGRPNGREFVVGADPLIRLNETEYGWHTAAASVEDDAAAKRLKKYSRGKKEKKGSPYNSIYDYYHAYKEKKTTPTRVLANLLDFINATDATLRCVEFIDERAKLSAEQSSQRWKDGTPISVWDGIPVLIKAEISIVGVPFTSGRQTRLDGSDLGTYDDIIVQRFRSAGAIVVGTTVMHEKGVQPTGYNPWYKGPNNPYGLSRFTGGSSSGSAVAVATGMVPVAVGFDGGGSIRIPASWSGTVGLAVGYSRIPFNNGKENLFTVAKSGVLSATVNDSLEALLLLGKGAAKDEGRDEHAYHVSYGGSGPPPPHSTPRWSERSIDQPIRIGIFWDWVSHRPSGSSAGTTGKDDAVYKSFVDTVETLKSHVHHGRRFEVAPFTIPHMNWQAMAHGILITSMFSFGNLRELYRGMSGRETPDADDDLQPATEIQIKLGSQITALELLACYTIRNFALAQWRKVLLDEVDVVLTPTTPMTALERHSGSDENGFTATGLFIQIIRFLWPGNLLGLPGLAVPIGADSDGLPISMQVICAHWHEADCLSLGNIIEDMRGDVRPVPPSELFLDMLR